MKFTWIWLRLLFYSETCKQVYLFFLSGINTYFIVVLLIGMIFLSHLCHPKNLPIQNLSTQLWVYRGPRTGPCGAVGGLATGRSYEGWGIIPQQVAGRHRQKGGMPTLSHPGMPALWQACRPMPLFLCSVQWGPVTACATSLAEPWWRVVLLWFCDNNTFRWLWPSHLHNRVYVARYLLVCCIPYKILYIMYIQYTGVSLDQEKFIFVLEMNPNVWFPLERE